jgi:hypothetical protein
MGAAARYSALVNTRQPYINRAKNQAKVTIPSLFPEFETPTTTELYTPYQSIGARGVNNLSAKLMLALFPPNASNFKLTVDDLTLEKLTKVKDARGEVETALSKIEKKALFTLETSQHRPTLTEVMKQLLVTGNACLYYPSPKEARYFKLNQYVVKRSPNGQVLEGVIKEEVVKAALPQAVQEWLNTAQPTLTSDLPSNHRPTEHKLDLYTHVILREDGKYAVHQEIKDMVIPGSEGTFKEDTSPYLFLRFNKLDNEDYGRGYVEDYYGDLYTLESLMEAMVSGSIIMAKFIFLVDPAGSTRAEDLTKAENGAFVEGRKDDITCLQTEKYADLNVVFKMVESIEQRLAYAFLLNTAIQRPGERVTAEEIRFMARELEDVLGGVYSVLSQSLQLRIAKIVLAALQASGDIPKLPPEVEPMIVTGVEALGRGQDLGKLNEFLAVAGQTLGPQVVAQYINPEEYLKRVAAALSIDTGGLIRTEDEIAYEQQQAQLSAMGPDAIKAGTALATKAMEQPQ